MELLTIDEAAKVLDVSVETLRKMRFRDTGPVSYKYNGKVGYRLEDLEQWRAEQLESGKRGGMRRTVRTFEDGFVE